MASNRLTSGKLRIPCNQPVARSQSRLLSGQLIASSKVTELSSGACASTNHRRAQAKASLQRSRQSSYAKLS
eukprot:11225858-Karenia_brevis.AAC.1